MQHDPHVPPGRDSGRRGLLVRAGGFGYFTQGLDVVDSIFRGPAGTDFVFLFFVFSYFLATGSIFFACAFLAFSRAPPPEAGSTYRSGASR